MAGRIDLPWASQRRIALLALVVAVLAMHAVVTRELASRMASNNTLPQIPPRMSVSYVREMVLAAPPVATSSTTPLATPAAPRPARHVARSKPKAVAPEAAASAPDVIAPTAAVPDPVSAPAELAPVAAQAEPVAQSPAPSLTEAALASASAASEPSSTRGGFEWPASTRLSYKLTGNFRGDVDGDAQVEWIHIDSRYQVHLDFAVGPSFAPLFARRMSSDGDITPEGLAPRRYDQETRRLFRDPQHASVQFEPDAVVLANGERRERPAGVQDTASQFVQLSYLFAVRPELLKSGASVEIALAFPYKVERWTYDVLEQEIVTTSFGELATFHLKSRREARAGGDLVPEIWFAPQLRYLPVRIRIRQDAETFIDLLISRRPEMASP